MVLAQCALSPESHQNKAVHPQITGKTKFLTGQQRLKRNGNELKTYWDFIYAGKVFDGVSLYHCCWGLSARAHNQQFPTRFANIPITSIRLGILIISMKGFIKTWVRNRLREVKNLRDMFGADCGKTLRPDPKPQTPNPRPETPDPKPQTLTLTLI